MPYEMGGRADKSGNRFEIRWIVYKILEILEEKLDHIMFEALGDDEKGVDVWIGEKNGSREGQQCKGRNGSKEYWDYGTANAKGIFTNWKLQLEREDSNKVALVSPLAFTLLEDLIVRAKNTSNSPKDFYEDQVLSASKEFNSFFKNFCTSMDINYENNIDMIKCISLLKRISYRQYPDSELKELILSKISYLLIGNEITIYETLVTWIIDGDILGRVIDQSFVHQFFYEKEIKLKNLANDRRIIPRLEELNQEYRDAFTSLNGELINRKEFSLCRKILNSEESLIVHGKAGMGKSGCTEDIINYCLESAIPYLAIKLDKRIPNGTAENWGEDLDLPSSIVHCVHSISKNEKAVIILDQLDALRWTQAHSRDSLLVCNQIINQVERINLERKYKISIVFVCRTYDLENDNNIKLMFKNVEKKKEETQWNKVQIEELDDQMVRNIIGNRYEHLTGKMRAILRIPSNIYIWEQLDTNKEYNECSTANHLIAEWWKQLEQKCFAYGLNESDINNSKETIISSFDKSGRISLPIRILKINQSCLDFLSSNGFILIQNSIISFAHQSILDYFLVEKMLCEYYEGRNVIEIIGIKEKQTPGKRYQLQMLLQNLIEFESKDFLNASMQILNSEQIRFSFKFVFFEVLNQINVLDENIQSYIVENCEDKIYSKHIINNVLYYKPQYIRLLRDQGILDRWFEVPEKKNLVFNLLTSMSPDYEVKDIIFIEKYAFQSLEDDNNFSRCFSHDINQDTDEMFELRMKFYQKYPQMANIYFDFKEMLGNCEMRTIRLFVFLLENKIKKHSKVLYRYENELLQENSEFLIKNSLEVINLLLPYIPISKDGNLFFSDWFARYRDNTSLERICIQIIKKANSALISLNPDLFWEKYNGYLGIGNDLYNEIVLNALLKLPYSYSDRVVNYLCENLNNNLFEEASGNGDELLLAKQVLNKHSEYCENDIFNLLEKKIVEYISPKAAKLYKRRIEFNNEHNGYRIYTSFWGDLQKELLEVLPYKRLSKNARELLSVLNRKFTDAPTLYKYPKGHSGFVGSPISEKKLSNENWLNILTNTKINKKSHSNWKEVPGGFQESSTESFSSSFNNVVSKEPERMIQLILSYRGLISDIYIDSLFSGVAHSENLNDVSSKLLEKMILKYLYNYTSYRANYICMIIEKKENIEWSQQIIDVLKDIAINHNNPENGKPTVTSNEDKEMRSFNMLQSNALNCVRGRASRAIAHLLWKDSNFFEQFQKTIERLTLDENPAVRLSSFFALWPSYNIEPDWTTEKLVYLYKQDYRFVGFPDTKNMFFLLYPKYRQDILNIIKYCYNSEDEELIKKGSHCLAEMFIVKNEFIDEMMNVDEMSELQAEEILYMTMLYFNKDEYNELAKSIIYRFKNSKLDLEMPISRLFYDNLINLERDKEFLKELLNSNLSRRSVYSFVHYLEEQAKSVIDYKDIIISMSQHLIQNNAENYEDTWGVQSEISKLVIGLYDETSGESRPELKNIAQECLNIWDLMFEKQIGSVRRLNKDMMER